MAGRWSHAAAWWRGHRLAAAVLAVALAGGTAAGAVEPPRPAAVGLPSPALQAVLAWIVNSGDSHGLPFAIVDKVAARVDVFDAGGSPRGSSVVLLGFARGDGSAPGIGDRPLAAIRPDERTTPAGRFDAQLGVNAAGHAILWVDYAAAISMHAVITSNPAEHRLARLASATIADRRISYGCINVPAAFFTGTVLPVFHNAGGVVYVLPEQRALREVFALDPSPSASRAVSGRP